MDPPDPRRFRSTTMRRLPIRTATIAGAIVAAACVYDAPTTPTGTIAAANASNSPSLQLTAGTAESGGRYLIAFKPGRTAGPAITDELRTGGGQLEGLYEQLGFAVVSGVTSDAAARLANANGVSSVEPDVEFAIEPMGDAQALEAGEVGTQKATTPPRAPPFARPWDKRADPTGAAPASGV